MNISMIKSIFIRLVFNEQKKKQYLQLNIYEMCCIYKPINIYLPTWTQYSDTLPTIHSVNVVN